MAKIKAGTVVKLNHPCYGDYGIVTLRKRNDNVVFANAGFNLQYDDETLAKFQVVGIVEIGKKYGSISGTRFANVSCAGQNETVVTREGKHGSDTTSANEIRVMGFLKMFPAVVNE